MGWLDGLTLDKSGKFDIIDTQGNWQASTVSRRLLRVAFPVLASSAKQ
jgi:hypothetical protein